MCSMNPTTCWKLCLPKRWYKTTLVMNLHCSFVISLRRVSVAIIPVSDILRCFSHSTKFSSNFRLSDSSTSASTEVWFCFWVRVRYWMSSDTGHLQHRLKFELSFALVRYCISNIQSTVPMPRSLFESLCKTTFIFPAPV